MPNPEFTKRLYLEDGGEYLVDKLRDETEEREDGHKWRSITVRCIKVLVPSRMARDPAPGDEWTAECRADCQNMAALWCLAFPPAEMMAELIAAEG